MKAILMRAQSFLDREPDLWREDIEQVELSRRFLWFLLLRFGIAIVLLILALAKGIITPHLNLNVSVLVILSASLFAANLLYWLHYRRAVGHHGFSVYTRMIYWNIQFQIICDFLVLGYLVYECGGIESPLVYFFLFHNTLSCLFFKKRVSIIHTAIAIAIVVIIEELMVHGMIPEKHFINPNILQIEIIPQGFANYYLAGIMAVYMVAWYLISTITDSLKGSEAMLQQKIGEMEELVSEKTRYMLVSTHELKAPFAAIHSYVNVALGGFAGEVPDKLRAILKKIGKRCEAITMMITEMLQLANITSLKGRSDELKMERMDITRSTSAVIERFREMANDKGLSFAKSGMKGEFHYVVANAEQIDILLSNLVKNAIAYSYPGTAIEVAIEDVPGHVIIRISDKGIGIKKDNLEKVFLEHFRTEKAAEMNPSSSGLGLTIARQIMDIHKGKIWIDSEEGVGTSVFTEFPAADR